MTLTKTQVRAHQAAAHCALRDMCIASYPTLVAFTSLVSTPEQKCIGLPEQKYISELARRPWPFLRHQAWVGLSAGVSELARRERRLL
jgi:hypothetical protein